MAFITWDDSFSVRINSIDEQHKKLISLINDYYDSVLKNSSLEGIKDLIKGLEDYTIYHFSYEEDLMKKYAYKGYYSQKEEHDTFKEKIAESKKKINEGKLLPIQITNFLKTWLTDHIKKSDKGYSDLFISKGVV